MARARRSPSATSRPSSSPSATGRCGRPGASTPGCRRTSNACSPRRATCAVASGIVSIWAGAPDDVGPAVAALEDRFPGRFLLGLGTSHGADRPRLRAALLARWSSYLDALDALEHAGAAGTARAGRPRPPHARARRRPRPPAPTPTSSRSSTPPGPAPSSAPARCWRPRWRSSSRPTRPGPGSWRRRYASTYLDLPNYTQNLRTFGFGDDDIDGGGSDRLIDAVIPWGDADDGGGGRPRPPRRGSGPRLHPGRGRPRRASRWTSTGTSPACSSAADAHRGTGGSARPDYEPSARCGQRGGQRPKGAAAVGHRVLLGGLHLGEGPPVPAVGHERPGRSRTRCLPRASVAMVPGSTPSAHTSDPSGNAASATVLKRARRAPAAVLQQRQLAQQLGDVVGVGGVLAGVAGRVDPGRAAQGVHLQPGVVGHRRRPGRRHQGARLQAGVADQRVGVLHHVGDPLGARQQLHGEGGRQHGHDLLDLVRVGRRQHELLRPAPSGPLTAAAVPRPGPPPAGRSAP